MTEKYVVTFWEGEEPLWFKKAYDAAMDHVRKEGNTFYAWHTVWNTLYTSRLSHSGHEIRVTFDSEAEFTAFLLRIL